MKLLMDLFSFLENYALLAGAFALALYLLSLIPKSRNYKSAPQVSGAWPIIGHFNLFKGSSGLLHIALGALGEKYGPIFTLRLGIHRVLVVQSWQIAKELYTTHDALISSRPKGIASKIIGYNDAMFGWSPHGPYWRDMRRIAALELLSSRRLEQLKHVRVSELENSIKSLYEVWKEKRDGTGKALVGITKWAGEINMNVVLRMVAGKRFSGGRNAEEEDEINKSREVIKKFVRMMGLFVVGDILPYLGWLDLGGHEKTMKKFAKEIDGLVGKWLDEHRSERKSQEAFVEKDFMDVMISTLETGSLGEYDADTIIKATCMVLIAGSVDSNTIMVTWTLSLLLNNPQTLKKAQEELDKFVGRERQVNESDIPNLVYLQAIVKETLRLYPAGRLGGRRIFSKDCTVAGYHVPKGTWLLVNLWKLQQDPEVWSNPTEFRPERFLDEKHKHVDVKGTHFELLPFGAGRRACPAISFALQMLHLVVASVLQNFHISTPGDVPVDMTEAPAGSSNDKASPLEVLISPRMSYAATN